MNSIKAVYFVLLTFALVATLGIGASAEHNTDAGIEKSVKKSFVFKNYLKNDDIKVDSKDGAVTLSGNVSAAHHKTLAYDTAAAQHGVKTVDNQLEVDSSAPADKSDAWLTAKVKTMLLFHRSVSAVNTNVDTKEGVVTLSGSAQNQAQKDLTTEYIRDVEGVKDVDNRLSISNKASQARKLEDRIDDSSITAQAKLALLFHRSTSGLSTHIETRNGVVTLTGSAKSTASKDLAEKIVSDLKGVRSVKNRINVDKA